MNPAAWIIIPDAGKPTIPCPTCHGKGSVPDIPANWQLIAMSVDDWLQKKPSRWGCTKCSGTGRIAK